MITCPTCDGSQEVITTCRHIGCGGIHTQRLCPTCDGQGQVPPLVIVGCGASKHLAGRWLARHLYTGDYFQKRLAYARTLTDDRHILILSAHYGLIGLDVKVTPYDLRLGQPGSVTASQLKMQLQAGHEVMGDPDWLAWPQPVVLAGSDYVQLAAQVWPAVATPLAGMGIGQQLAWLKEHTTPTGANT